jgi:hypothetical protein
MKQVIGIALFLLTITTYGQECKFEENKTDEFTKEKVVRLKKKRVFSKMSWTNYHMDFSLAKYDTLKMLTVVLTEVTTGSRYGCFKDEILYLKLANDSIIKLTNISRDCGTYQTTPQGYYYILGFGLTNKTIESLKSSPIIKLKLVTIEGDVKESCQKYFIENLDCLDK